MDAQSLPRGAACQSQTARRSRRRAWRSPWLNGKLLVGSAILLCLILIGVVGPLLWDTRLALTASSPTNLPPMWVHDGHRSGVAAHPLGTDSNGRDMLAVVIVGVPASLRVGFLSAAVGMGVALILGGLAGYFGGYVDDVVRTLTDSWIVIPSLAVLVVISAYIRIVDLNTMAFVLALFAWPGPTRLVRSLILSLRERGYVRMAILSGVPAWRIIFGEILPNILPWLAASMAAIVSAMILAAAGLEVLGLGPQRLPTLGMTIFHAIQSAAIIRGMWWWWGVPIAVLIVLFTALFLISIGLDEIANPRLRGMVNQ